MQGLSAVRMAFMLQCITSPSMKPSLPSLATALVVTALATVGTCAHAQQDGFGADLELDTLAGNVLDPTVYATLMPNPDVVDPALVQSAIAAAMAAPPRQPKTIVPITATLTQPGIRPVRIDPNSLGNPITRMVFDSNQLVQLHADGMPAPNGPDRDPLVRVLPRSANPADVTFGARWSAADRIEAPLLSSLSWDVHADVVTGAPAPRAGAVRRSLRITAMWDTPEDMSIGFTPGFTRGGGMAFEHYVAGLEVTTLDKTKTARWHSFVELSGEKLAFNNVIENSTAHVAAGASYSASSSTQLDFSVSRGTTWQSTDLQSSVGLSVHF
jgi:hypothetical protein